MKKIESKKMKYIVLIGLLIIPFMYSFFYLKAFWDPYGKMEDIPVALVCLDEGEKGKDLVETLTDKKVLHFDVVTSEKAEEGLQDEKYYAVITIPKNFTSNLENIKNKDRKVTTITYSPNQKSNYLASQIISRVVSEASKEITSEVNEGIVETLTGKLEEVPEQVTKIEEGLGEIEKGTGSLKEGSSALVEGSDSLVKGVNTLKEGIHSAESGSKTLKEGAYALQSGTTALNEGINAYVNTVNQSVGTLSTSMVDLKTAMKAIDDLNKALQNPNLDASTRAALQAKLTYTIGAVNQSLSALPLDQLGTLTEAGNSIKTHMKEVTIGTQNLYQGASQLNSGLTELGNGATTLQSGTLTLQKGIQSLDNGAGTLQTGVHTAKDEVTKAKTEAIEELKNTEGLSSFAKSPVSVEEKDTPKVTEYGTAFAPYFISISLWVGALMLFVVLFYDVEDRFKVFSRNAENKVKRTFAYISLAVVQAIALGFLLKWGLGFSVTNYFLYFASLILASAAFILIIEFLIVHFGDVGKFLAILLLVLQLASSAGTFPIETVPRGFQMLYPFMPMRYTIHLVKESLIQIDGSMLTHNLLVVVLIILVFLILNLIKDKREEKVK